jgi:periplasmic divalent cation tolerance protein
MPLALSLLYTTLATAADAEAIAATLLQEKLIACANIVPGVCSLYHWEGNLEKNEEVILLLKTPAKMVKVVEARLAALHPYDCPAILTFAADRTTKLFAEWAALQIRA